MIGQLESTIRQLATSEFVEINITRGPGHAVEIARQAPAGSRVVAVGGDGTVHEVIRGLAHSDKAVGVVPIGSGNDFARMIGLKGKSLEESLTIALNGQQSQVDLLMVNGHPFGSNLAIGFDAAVARKALEAPKFLRGMLRYLYSIFLVLGELSLPELELSLDGQPIFKGKALLTAFLNGSTYGGGIPMAPQALPTDGLISGVIAGEFSRLGVVGILPQLLLGKHIYHPRIKLFNGKQISVHFDRPIPAALDGELIEPQATYSVELIPSGLKVVIPK